MNNKRAMITANPNISLLKQCEIIDLNCSSYYYTAIDMSHKDRTILNEMDRIYTDYPFYGYRKIHIALKNKGFCIGKDRVLKYKRILGLNTFYPKKRTTIPDSNHKIYPYLLKGLSITTPNQVWSTDITYIRMKHGFCYLVAIIDWYSRKILSFRLSNTMDVNFCVDALNEALDEYPNPEIFNTDQGSQFTSTIFTNILLDKKINISMDSKGRATDNIIIERFWRSIKYENIYLNEYQNIFELELGIDRYIKFYNHKRFHQSLNYKTPNYIYENLNKEVIVVNGSKLGQLILEKAV